MILPTHRAFRLTFACLFGLLLMFGLLTALPAQAQEGASASSRNLIPLGRNCSGLSPGDQTPVCCAAGYVLVDGVPVAGAEVEISSDEGTLVVHTASGGEISEPYYAVSLSDTLAIEPGEWVTFTVRYDDFTVIRAHQAIAGGQQVDLVINTFEDGRFEGTNFVSDTVRLFHRPTANVKANDDDVANVRLHPKLAVDSNGKFYAVWADNRNHPDRREIYFSYSTDGGQSWSSNIAVYNEPLSSIVNYPSSLITDANGTLYVAWSKFYKVDDFHLKRGSYFSKSMDGGESWSAPVSIANSDQSDSIFPTLALDHDGNLITAWLNYGDNKKLDIHFAKSTDGGESWSNSVKVNDDSRTMEWADLVYPTPSLVVDGNGTLMLAWTDNRNDHLDIYFARSEDGGQSWLQPNVRINHHELNDQVTPWLTVGENNAVYAVWADERDGTSKVYFAKSSDGGLNWSHSDLVNPPSDMSTQHDPRVVVSEGDIYVAWRKGRNENSNLLLARSSDEGQSWRLIGQVNDVNDQLNVYKTFSYAPTDLAVDGSGNLYFIWTDKRNHHFKEDIYTARWPDPNHFYSEGTYTSQVYDAREVVGWRTLEWAESLPDGAAITMAVRTGNTPTAGDNWSEWQTFMTWPADLSELPHGRYLQWRARLSTTLSTNTPILSPIALTVESPALTPEVQTDPGAIIFGAKEGGENPGAQWLEIMNGGTGTFAWTATTNTPWLQLGSTSGMANETIAVQADSSALAEGTHRGEIILSAPGVPNSPQTIEVVLNVTRPDQSVWTMMFYVAADNDLAFGLKNKQLSLQEAAQHANLNILVLMDLADSGDTQLYQVLPDGLLTYTPGNVPWLASEMDMGDPETLRQFVSWAKEEYPADLTYLNIANHGKGTQGIAWDEQSSSFLPVSELSEALNAATNTDDTEPTNDKPIDVLHYDACLMAMFEGAYDVREAADYLVASQNLAWSLFMFRDYANAAAVSDSPSEFAREVADLYHESLTIEGDDYPETISAIDLSKIEQVNDRLNELVAALDANLDVETLRAARSDTQKFDSRNYYQIDNQDEYLDLYDLALNIQVRITDSTVQAPAQALMESIEDAVIVEHHFSDEAYGHHWDVENAHGLSIYFPSAPSIGTESDYQRYLDDRLFAFTQESQYDELLAAVLSDVPAIDAPDDRPPVLPVYPLTATQAISMSVGWHLISIPGESASSDVSDVLDSIAGNYETAYANDACDISDSWKIYDPSAPPFANDLTEIDRTKGIWVNMTVTDTLVMTSTVPVSTTIDLCTGWNLVGYPSAHERPIVEALESITGTYSIIYAYDTTNSDQQWKKYDPNAPVFANTLDVMKPEWGYWIHVDQDVEWTIVNQ